MPDRKQLTHRVLVLVDGRLDETVITARGSYLYTCVDESATVFGALVEDRYMPRKHPVRMEKGDFFEVEPDDVYNAFARVDPIEHDEQLGLQSLRAVAETGNDVVKPPDADELYWVAAPTVFLAPPETPTMWAERTYTQVAFRKATDHSFERDLVVDSPLGRYRLVACWPAGLPQQVKDEHYILPLRFRRAEPLDLRALATDEARGA